MHILITGAAGMIGRKLTERLLGDSRIGKREITKLTLHDIVTPDARPNAHTSIRPIVGDLSDKSLIDRLISEKPDMVIHLAAIVSGEAEADFAKGYAVNFDGTRLLFDAIREQGSKPRVIYASSIAVYGAPFPEPIPDDFHLTPLTSYGTQKAVGEFILNDYTRRGFFDGIGLRLPTICVRPGKPNKAASGFFSGIIREPLKGEEALLPVADTVRHWHASPRSAVGFFVHAAEMDLAPVGPRRCLTLPGVAATVGEQIEALPKGRRREGGQAYPPAARSSRAEDRCRVADILRSEALTRFGLQGGRQLRGDHPRPHRGRARRSGPDHGLTKARRAAHINAGGRCARTRTLHEGAADPTPDSLTRWLLLLMSAPGLAPPWKFGALSTGSCESCLSMQSSVIATPRARGLRRSWVADPVRRSAAREPSRFSLR